jgi:hypothetical protein
MIKWLAGNERKQRRFERSQIKNAIKKELAPEDLANFMDFAYHRVPIARPSEIASLAVSDLRVLEATK